MSNAELLSKMHEYRSIIWFFVILAVIALLGFAYWVSSVSKDGEGFDSSLPEEFPMDRWDS